LDGLNLHGVDDAGETDDEIVIALLGQHRLDRVQVVFQIKVLTDVCCPVHVHYSVYFSKCLYSGNYGLFMMFVFIIALSVAQSGSVYQCENVIFTFDCIHISILSLALCLVLFEVRLFFFELLDVATKLDLTLALEFEIL
jgi:hypothetical protein